MLSLCLLCCQSCSASHSVCHVKFSETTFRLLKKFIKDFIRARSSNRGFGVISSKKEKGKGCSALLIFKAE